MEGVDPILEILWIWGKTLLLVSSNSNFSPFSINHFQLWNHSPNFPNRPVTLVRRRVRISFVFSDQMFLKGRISFKFGDTEGATKRQLVLVTFQLVTVQFFDRRTFQSAKLTDERSSLTVRQMKQYSRKLSIFSLGKKIYKNLWSKTIFVLKLRRLVSCNLIWE
jgi:hypothetical protein